ncbi:MAG TPA: phosphotransferase family protein [Solirubrobacterales bacterium]|nr:phosphotransferase family protein [Solirubrobacterales bacterium]
MEAATGTEPDLAAGVQAVLAELGDDPGGLSLSPIPGGASRETWLVEPSAAPGREAEEAAPLCVLRRDPKGSVSLVPMGEEFDLIRLAAEAGVPVPRPLAFEPDGGRFGSPGILMGFVAGTSVAPRILRKPEYEAARRLLVPQLAEALARIHSVPVGALEGVLPAPAPDPALGQIAEWERQLDEIGEPLPVVELGLRWLRSNAPEPAAPRLVHGDFRLGNFIVGEGGLAAVIDWELAHLGDPAEDIGWLCIRSWRFGNDESPVAGVGGLDEFAAAYEAAGGEPVNRERVRYWEVFGNVKWAVICARQAQDHLSGVRRSHELASLGRRVCEPEWDMLELIRGEGA